MRLVFEVAGDRQIERELLRWSGRVGDARPAFVAIADLLRSETKEQFATEGRHASGGWAPLKATTLAEKQRKGQRLQILQRIGSLKSSLTVKGDPNQVLEIKPTSLLFGTRVPYAGFHQTGTKWMPKRPPLELTEAARRAIVKLVQAHIVGELP